MAVGAGIAEFLAGPVTGLKVFVGTGIAADDLCIVGSTGTYTAGVLALTDADSDGYATVNLAKGYIIKTTVYGLDSAGSTGCGCTIGVGQTLYLEGSATTYQVNKSSTGGISFGRFLGIYSGTGPIATTIAVLATATNAVVWVF